MMEQPDRSEWRTRWDAMLQHDTRQNDSGNGQPMSRGAGSPGQGVNWPPKLWDLGSKNWYLANVEQVIFDLAPTVEKWFLPMSSKCPSDIWITSLDEDSLQQHCSRWAVTQTVASFTLLLTMSRKVTDKQSRKTHTKLYYIMICDDYYTKENNPIQLWFYK